MTIRSEHQRAGLVFALGGLSKTAGLPHVKLSWIAVGGDRESRQRALEALDYIADVFLSVSSSAQLALPPFPDERFPSGRLIDHSTRDESRRIRTEPAWLTA